MESSTNPINTPMPIDEPLLLALISEELKSRRFFSTLQELGLDDSHFQPHLDQLIMQGLGLADDNATMYRYFRIMDEHAHRLTRTEESVHAQASEVYAKLRSNRHESVSASETPQPHHG